MSRILSVLPCLIALAAASASAQPVDPQNPYGRPPPQRVDPQNPYAPPAPPPPGAPVLQPACPPSRDQVYVAGQWMRRGQGLIGAAQDYWSNLPLNRPAAGVNVNCPPPPGPASLIPPAPRR